MRFIHMGNPVSIETIQVYYLFENQFELITWNIECYLCLKMIKGDNCLQLKSTRFTVVVHSSVFVSYFSWIRNIKDKFMKYTHVVDLRWLTLISPYKRFKRSKVNIVPCFYIGATNSYRSILVIVKIIDISKPNQL